ncbi:hypothetical protein [Vagococcus carniphilus]|uniref:hypothetical protein n=1 Tax=Vagococcus carniphilus TaxID=218144 RepID=UPI00288F561A|nr:hypothetical protein [Vagococcus carniphilus]MDT2839298.1 hypothetical protein [Vagococcus carniphilus]
MNLSNNEEIENNKLTENDMKLARIDQRKYIRENLKGGSYFYDLAGIDRDNFVDELEIEVTEDGYSKEELDLKIAEQNSVMELFALQQGKSEEFNSEAAEHYSASEDNKKALSEIMEMVEFTNRSRKQAPEVEESKPLTNHEQIIEEIRLLREQQTEQNMTPEQKQARARKDLKEGLNKMMGWS